MANKYEPDLKWIESLNEVPDFWKGSLEDIEQVLGTVKRGRVTLGCLSAGGRKVYMVEYGQRNQLNRTATYCSATCVNYRDLDAYADKKREGVKPCLFLMGGIHGAEFEGTVSILNLIRLLETGKDFLGQEHPELTDLAERMHLILVPCANPDGRARFPYRSIVGIPRESFLYYAQGTWKNGELCGHPACKRCHPIRDHADFLGCYFNDDGVNIQQDAIVPLAKETRFLMETAHEFAPDVLMNIHGATSNPSHIMGCPVMPPKLGNEVVELEGRLFRAFTASGFKYTKVGRKENPDREFYPLGLTGALHLCCGGLSMTFESNQGVDFYPGDPWYQVLDHEQIYRTHILLYRELFQYTLERFQRKYR